MPDYTFTASARMEEVLADLAASQGVSKAQVLRRAIGLLQYLTEQHDAGATIQIVSASGEVTTLDLTSGIDRGADDA